MKIYVWSSEGLRNYGPGKVAAMADSIDAAREKIKNNARERYGAKSNQYAQIMLDIQNEPYDTTDVLFIEGQE